MHIDASVHFKSILTRKSPNLFRRVLRSDNIISTCNQHLNLAKFVYGNSRNQLIYIHHDFVNLLYYAEMHE